MPVDSDLLSRNGLSEARQLGLLRSSPGREDGSRVPRGKPWIRRSWLSSPPDLDGRQSCPCRDAALGRATLPWARYAALGRATLQHRSRMPPSMTAHQLRRRDPHLWPGLPMDPTRSLIARTGEKSHWTQPCEVPAAPRNAEISCTARRCKIPSRMESPRAPWGAHRGANGRGHEIPGTGRPAPTPAQKSIRGAEKGRVSEGVARAGIGLGE